MNKVYASTFNEGWKQIVSSNLGGEWCEIITDDAIYAVRPDGSLCEPKCRNHGTIEIRIDVPNVCYYVTVNGQDYSRHNDIKAAEAVALELQQENAEVRS